MKRKAIVGMLVTLFLVTTVFSGIQTKAAAKDLKIGVVGPVGMIQWDGLWEGAQMARDKINDAGGLTLGGDTYTVVLVDIDSHAYPVIDPAAGVVELMAVVDDLDFVIGGFRSECVFPMVEAFCDWAVTKNGTAAKQPVWYIAGAATDELMVNVNNTSTNKYKVMFRVTPMSTSVLIGSLLGVMAGWVLGHQLVPMYGIPVKTYMVIENLVWADAMPGAFPYYLAYPGGAAAPFCDFVGSARPAWDETDFSAILSDIEAKDARLVIHVFSALGGAPFIKQFGEREIPAVACGINVESQRAEFYDTIGGKCEYESFLASVGSRTPIWESLGWGTATQDFWDEYNLEFGHSPLYTAWGSYDGIMGFSEFFENNLTTWTEDYDNYISTLASQERRGLLGSFKFTPNHDVYAVDTLDTWPAPHYVRTQIPQWQDGNLEVVWPRDQTYSRKYKIPPYMYDHIESDWFGTLDLTPPHDPTIGPDGLVDSSDLAGTLVWQSAPYPLLEADMDGNNFINILDISKVAINYGYNASAPENYGQWPLP